MQHADDESVGYCRAYRSASDGFLRDVKAPTARGSPIGILPHKTSAVQQLGQLSGPTPLCEVAADPTMPRSNPDRCIGQQIEERQMVRTIVMPLQQRSLPQAPVPTTFGV